MGTNDFNGTEVATSILSCIYRVNQRFGFGINYIASILVGSKSQRVLKYNHDKIESHNALNNYSLEQVKTWIKELISKGFIEQTKGEYPTVKLLDKSNAILAGKEQVSLSEPDPNLATSKFAEKGESAKKTWELYKIGKTVAEIATERNLAQATILSHLAYSFQKGEQIDINQFVPIEKQTKITEAFQKLGTDYLSPVKQSLDQSFTWEDLKWVRAKLLREQAVV
ncbi:helix-turn-helix domain-containing protein [Candidatus Daviesbacteria bacterium]|nr:helix-turn-helix domain-containing protein [Candidatus Daviesbacteria bacterium]